MSDIETGADPLAGLFGVRLPPDAPFQPIADLAAAAGVGLLVALLLAPLLGRITRRKPKLPTLEEEIAALADQPEDVRVPALLRLLLARAPDRARAYGAALYQPESLPGPAEIERALREVG